MAVRRDPLLLLRDVGRRVAELRQSRGMTQETLAERADVSVRYVQRVERGGNLTLLSLARFAELLGVTVVDLLAAPASREIKRGRPARKAPRAG